MKWVEAPAPILWNGSDWCARHIKAVVNIGAPFLGVPKTVSALFSAGARDTAVARAVAPSSWIRMFSAFRPCNMLSGWLARGSNPCPCYLKVGIPFGATLIGRLNCSNKKQKNNDSHTEVHNGKESLDKRKKPVHYGRIISFGKDVADMHSSDINRVDFRVRFFSPRVAMIMFCLLLLVYNYTCMALCTFIA